MTAAQAVTLKAGLTAHITAEVDRVGGKRGHGGFMGRGMGSAPLAPAATVAPTST